jgi:hypothetical protein
MAVPWLRLLDAVIGVTDLARSRKIRSMAAASDSPAVTDPGSRALGGIEARLTGVVVAALKEAFDRDTRRLDLEREHLEAERRRAERAMRLELIRQAADREIGRLRLLAGVDLIAWLGSIALALRSGPGLAARATLGVSWIFLLAAIAASFSGQSAAARSVESERPAPTGPGLLALCLTIVGLSFVAVSVLL